MTIIRRIYGYLLAFAGLAMLSLAVANVAQLLVDLALRSPTVVNERYVRDTASLNGAAALVGLPVWLLHWLWIARTARSDTSERLSALRRLYLYAVLAGAAMFAAGSTADTLRATFAALVGVAPSDNLADAILRPLPFTVVALVVWFGHWRVAAADRAQVGETGGSAVLRSLYVYGAALIGLALLLGGVQGVVEGLWRTVFQGGGAAAAAGLPGPATWAIVGLGVWLVHWTVLPASLPAPARDDDGRARLRSAYLFLALAIGVTGALAGGSQLLYYAVARLLGVDRPSGVGGDLLQAAAGPTSILVVYGAAWAYHRVALRRQAASFGEAPAQAGIRRLYSYLVALVGLAVLASGVAGLLWTLGDLVVSAGGTPNAEAWRERVALYATLALIGLPAWLLHWRANPAEADETRSLARRLEIYLSLIVSTLILVGSAAAAVYRLLGLALGSVSTVEVMVDLAHATAVCAVAAVVDGYHWRVLRTDSRRAYPSSPSPSATPALTEPATAIVEIHAVDAQSLNRALTALRSTGVEVTVR
jgi:hypothetical protein